MLPPRRMPLNVITRYLLAEFWGVFLLCMGAFLLVYLLVDFFDRLDTFLKYEASASAALRYLLFKLPLIITQIVPPAVLASVLVSLGLLGRRNELTALRAGGVSLARMSWPLFAMTAVPMSTHESQRINLVEIRRQAPRTVLSDRETWYRGADGFYNIDHIDRARQTLYGMVIYHLSEDFRLLGTTEISRAYWDGSRWEINGAVDRRISPSGDVEITDADASRLLREESIGDFLEVYREPEELSYTMLKQRIEALSRKGIDASSYLVDLHLKLSVPFSSLVLAGLAIPIAGRARRHVSVAAIVATGIGVGFCYWVVLALGMSLGQSGALPPVAAAWAANVIAGMVAVFLFLSVE
jgi:lipopolysaccharide export system permease protein